MSEQGELLRRRWYGQQQKEKAMRENNWRYPDFKVEKGGVVLTAHIAPYSMGMPKLVVDVGEWQEQGSPIVSERITMDLHPKEVDDEESVLMALQLAVDKFDVSGVLCVRCGTKRLKVSKCNRFEEDLETDDYMPDIKRERPLCDSCFCKGLDARLAESQAKQDKLDAAEDAGLKAEGYTHKFVAWIHPKAGGDDYQIVAHIIGKPTKRQIGGFLRKSVIKNDYVVTEL